MSDDTQEGTKSRFRSALVEKFRVISRARLERLNLAVLEWEEHPGQVRSVEAAQREIHTLKGEAKLVRFADLSSLAHKTEELMLFAIDRKFRVGPSIFDTILTAFDAMGRMLEGSPETPSEFNLEAFAEAADEVVREATEASEQNTEAVPAPAGGEAEGPQVETGGKPSQRSASGSQETISGATELKGRGTSGPDTLPEQGGAESALARLMKVSTDNAILIDLRKIDRLTELVANLSQGLMWREHSDRALQRLVDSWRGRLDRPATQEPEPGELGSSGGQEAAQLRSLLDGHRDLLREFQGVLTERREAAFEEGLQLSHLEERFREVRMVPLSTLFSRLPRAVRDLGRELGKPVQLEIHGEQVEVDQRIHARIQEPLLHLVRNSIDHGLEASRDSALGEEVGGRLSLAAEHRGAHVSITVSDNGRGIDPEKLRQVAVDRGFLSPEQAAELDRQACFGLLFRSGFSTKEQVTEVSGRGIGLNVVRTEIEALGGSVRVNSILGAGTTFELQVPVSLTFRKLLLVQAAGCSCALPVTAVDRVLRLKKDEVKVAAGSEVFDLGSEVLPLVDLALILGFEEEAGTDSPADDEVSVLVLLHGGSRFGLRVARLIGERALLHRNLDSFLDGQSLINGTTLLEDGRLALILSVAGLAKAARAKLGSRRQRHATPRQLQRRVLVVDDSDLTRIMLVEILRGLGHRVFEATNGRQALQAVTEAVPHLILLDLEMPVMTGFEVLESLRGQSATQDIPVIVFSSRGSDEDKKRCLKLGANAYLVKSAFEELELERAVGRFL